MGFFDNLFGTGNNKSNDNRAQNTILNKDKTEQPLAFNGEEYSEEISAQVDNSTSYDLGNAYSSNGVSLQNVTNMARITYNGFLSQNGAQDIYAVIGYGNNLRWENTTSYKMQPKENKTFELLLPINYQGNINIAFKDSSDTWDNNNGLNYTFSNNIYQGSH